LVLQVRTWWWARHWLADIWHSASSLGLQHYQTTKMNNNNNKNKNKNTMKHSSKPCVRTGVAGDPKGDCRRPSRIM
jgi:hypothetical protein